ncbi:YjbQ family protein [Marinilabiliaceae bacterium JC017]|nr:YjbQ family protein [Marinilabiliaceae bacterium JC017]
MVNQVEFTLPEFSKGCHLITSYVEAKLGTLPDQGVLNVFIKHSSAGLTINENADPSVREDMNLILDKMVPERDPDYTHTMEGPDDMPAHGKASLTGASLTIPISNGQLNLGTWQGIYLCEFRKYGGARRMVLTVYY